MSEVIKFTEEELQSIAKLQSGYQQGIYALGQVDLEKIDLNFETIVLDNKLDYDVMTFDIIESEVIRYLGEIDEYYMVNLRINKLENIQLFNISGGITEELKVNKDELRQIETEIKMNMERPYYASLSAPPQSGLLYKGQCAYQKDEVGWYYFVNQMDPIFEDVREQYGSII